MPSKKSKKTTTRKTYEKPQFSTLTPHEVAAFEDMERTRIVQLAVEADRKRTNEIIRDYGKRYIANIFAEEVIDHLRFWREQSERSAWKQEIKTEDVHEAKSDGVGVGAGSRGSGSGKPDEGLGSV